jgi:8-oxo-dGTP diphosphatase
MLAAYGVKRLVSSTSTRCVSTLLPYAADRSLRISEHEQLTEERGADNPKPVAKVVTQAYRAALAAREPTAICVHRPVLPHILDALGLAPVTLVTGEFVVAHLTTAGEVHAIERHRPYA